MRNDIQSVISAALKIPDDSVVDDLEYHTIPEWDSIGHLQLMLALEAEFGISIDDDTILQLTTVSAIREFVSLEPDGAGKAA